MHSRITGTGSYLPTKLISNHELAEKVDTTDEWIQRRVGIKQRQLCADGESTHTMAHAASERAIEAAGISAQDIDAVIVGTISNDAIFPSCACMLQQSLGIDNNTLAFDLSAACAGFLYALNVAHSFIMTGQAKTILVVGAEAVTRYVDWSDRSTCVLFGDGAGAVILQASDTPGIVATSMHAAGSRSDLLYCKNSIWCDGEPQYIHMDGREVFRAATMKLSSLVDDLLVKANCSAEEIDWLVPHQANKRIINAVANKLGMDDSKIIQTIEEHANTSSASVPLALDHAVRTGKIQRGDLIFLEAFGAGFAWGAALIKY